LMRSKGSLKAIENTLPCRPTQDIKAGVASQEPRFRWQSFDSQTLKKGNQTCRSGFFVTEELSCGTKHAQMIRCISRQNREPRCSGEGRLS
jgi:hypothetical protein